jgi:Holliday junction DNA helicase RuvA
MIGFIQGKVLEISEDGILINVRGVGYELTCTTSTLEKAQSSEWLNLWVHTHVREDALQLFGFSSRAEKRMFLSLIKINGIGPRSAIHILSGATLEQLVAMIESGDVKGLSKLPKVGKKTAEQMILALKGHLVLDEESPTRSLFQSRDEIISALVHLGFKLTDVEKVVDRMPAEFDVQTGVRQGLSLLTSAF